jgi:EmrB/QacA subfamily drug resistance transporter
MHRRHIVLILLCTTTMKIARNTIVLLAVSSSIFFEALDIAIINLAIPLIKADFNLSGETVQWVQTLYVLFYGGFLIVGGKLADVVGRKKIFILGSGLFLVTSLGAALAPSFEILCLFRAIQGLGAAFVMPSAFSIITNTFQEPQARTKALGIFGSFAAVGSGSGLSLGGIIATYFGWQWVFYINVPVIAISLFFAFVYITPDEKYEAKNNPDYLTGILLTLTILILTFIVHDLKNIAHHFYATIIMLMAMLLMIRSIISRSKSENPLIDFKIFNTTSTRSGNGVMFLMGAFFTGFLFTISIVMQSYMGFSAAKSGLLLLPFSIMSAFVSKSVLPWLLKRISTYQGGILGMGLMTSGGILLFLGIAFDYNLIIILLSVACVTGTGIAVCFITLNVIALRDIPEENHGVASSFIQTCFFFGGGLGLSILTIFMETAEPLFTPALILTSYATIGVVWLMVARYRRGLT